MLKIDFWNILWTVVNLLVLYLLMKRFLFGPILNIIDQRKALIDGQFASAKEAEKKAMEMKTQYEASLNNAREESMQILDKARVDGQAEYQRIVNEASDKAGKLMADAQTSIAEEKKKALKDMESEITGLAMEAAEKILTDLSKAGDSQ